ncbi:molybdopterin-guanine dinucleotide biosynthesis protein B [candidate division WOR-3 bacterium]|nr:molybdopterin-guanine dinucleotide biosynthesis protein B [candidate division WOR-3 bacterium]
MLLIGITGVSDTGKTRLINQLITELNKRGYRVGCIKHCPRGFKFDLPDKDSFKFRKSGARGVVLSSPNEIGLIKISTDENKLEDLAINHLSDCDFVLIEGYKRAKAVKKIELLRIGISEKPRIKDSVAIISNFSIKTEKPTFHPDDIKNIVNFLEKLSKGRDKITRLKINEKIIPLNSFVKNALTNILLGFLSTLKIDEDRIYKVDIRLEA